MMTTAKSEEAQDPRSVYGSRIAYHHAQARTAQARDRLFSALRLVAILWTVVGLGILSFLIDAPDGAWSLLPASGVLAFVGLVVAHERAIRRGRRARRAMAYLERGLARLEGGWSGLGESGDRYRQARHPYADDLDLFGTGSLFEYLNTARTRAGEATLASWLQRPAEPAKIRARQQAVAELRERLDLREDLALLGETLRAELHPDALESWAAEDAIRFHPAAPWLASLLGLANLLAALAWPILGAGPLPLVATCLASAAFALVHRRRVTRIASLADDRLRDLGLLAQLLARLEREAFVSPLLRETLGLLEGRARPSETIAELARLVGLLDWRRNQLFIPIAYTLLWTTQIALRVERWRSNRGASVHRWLEAVGKFEALASLATFSWEHPEDPFPEILEGDDVVFEGLSLGHPLIPEEVCVRNDLRLTDSRRLLVISGSNMSGKSTMLRTVGVNAVLALAGAPVRATSLRLGPLVVGASIRVQDSLQDGASRFYAEITRLRQVFDLLEERRRVLFLLDELLQGTNSHDRRIGAEAVIRGLLERGAVGLLTTHDLALTEMTEGLGFGATNVHFEDQMVGGEMHFDYRVRDGVVTHSNALALMRAVGLDV